MRKKVLVIGSGGREHALCWKLNQSERVSSIIAAPGNPGMARLGDVVPIAVDDFDELVRLAHQRKVDLTIVGPENPLADGIVDRFREVGLRIFGPTREAAQLESSKHFAKDIMSAADVPAAAYKIATTKPEALQLVRELGAPVVLKADGLAAGKGVFVCKSIGEAEVAAQDLFWRFHSSKVLVEECLTGTEASFIVAVGRDNIIPLATSHDYKRIFDNDEGPNTGGMGTVSPTPHLNAEQEEWVMQRVIRPVVAEMSKRGISFTGFLYAGLMIGADGQIKVLEFNVRMGDPEGQVILRRMESDLFSLLYGLSSPYPDEDTLKQQWSSDSAVCVVLAAPGYPGRPEKGDEIKGIADAEATGAVIFQAGTALEGEKLVSAGGRVLNVTGVGADIAEARAKAYQAVEQIKWMDKQYRKDIGVK